MLPGWGRRRRQSRAPVVWRLEGSPEAEGDRLFLPGEPPGQVWLVHSGGELPTRNRGSSRCPRAGGGIGEAGDAAHAAPQVAVPPGLTHVRPDWDLLLVEGVGDLAV